MVTVMPYSSPQYVTSLPHIDSDMDDSQSDTYSTFSLPLFSPSPSIGNSSYTSCDVSLRSRSPAPSVWSITNSVLSQAFKQEFGRGINNYSEVYRLPADEEELDRLGKQYVMFQEVIGNYPPPMFEAMADDTPGEIKACLDLGCGSGHWIMDCARNFPHCSAVAVDLVPMQSLTMPMNCRSEVDDINLGLEHFYGDFNVVHAQLISSGIRDYENLIDQISRVLRPGGLVIIVEWDFQTYDVDGNRIEVGTRDVGPPWWPRWLAFVRNAVRNSGGSVDAADHLHDWVHNHPFFENIVEEDFWIPTSHWATHDEHQFRVGTTMRDDILAFLRSGRPLLLGSGVPEAVVNELEYNATMEITEAVKPGYVRVRRVYARKKQS